MIRLAILLSCLLVSGCLTTGVPISPKFPEAEAGLLEKCQDLETVPDNTEKLSEALKVITRNYSEYHKCRERVADWVTWYNKQKAIYEKVSEPESPIPNVIRRFR